MVQVISIDPQEGARFDDIIDKTSALVKFYDPECPHCKNMKQAWIDLGKTLENEYDGNVALIEVHAEAIPQIKCHVVREIKGYPTIIEILKGGKKGAEYMGNRSTEDMLKFMESKLGISKKMKGGSRRSRSRGSKRSRSRSRSGGKRRTTKSRKHKRHTRRHSRRDRRHRRH
jgi:hypothetical protein